MDPGLSLILSDAEREARVRRDLGHAFRARLVDDSMLVLLGHGALIGLVAVLIARDVPGTALGAWLAAVALTTLARTLWLRRAARSEAPDRAILPVARVATVAQGLSWGLGAALLAPRLPVPDLAVILVVMAGIGAGALGTLAPDEPSFVGFIVALGGPLPFGVLWAATDRMHLVVAALVVVFSTVILILYRHAHAGLAEQLRASILLSLSEEAEAKLIVELRDALAQNKLLSGLLPMCANCKRIRNAAGEWQTVEHYVGEHTSATFSHGLCPDCHPKLFPGVPYPGEDPR